MNLYSKSMLTGLDVVDCFLKLPLEFLLGLVRQSSQTPDAESVRLMRIERHAYSIASLTAFSVHSVGR